MATVSVTINATPNAPSGQRSGWSIFDSMAPLWDSLGDVVNWRVSWGETLGGYESIEHTITWFVHDASKWRADILEMFPYASPVLVKYGDAFSVVRATIDNDDVVVIANQLAMDAFWAARPGGEKCQR